jgi:hypothetical protein
MISKHRGDYFGLLTICFKYFFHNHELFVLSICKSDFGVRQFEFSCWQSWAFPVHVLNSLVISFKTFQRFFTKQSNLASQHTQTFQGQPDQGAVFTLLLILKAFDHWFAGTGDNILEISLNLYPLAFRFTITSLLLNDN